MEELVLLRVQRKSFIFLVLTKKHSETEMYFLCSHHVQRCLTSCSIICNLQLMQRSKQDRSAAAAYFSWKFLLSVFVKP